jgi:hypothetical protein
MATIHVLAVQRSVYGRLHCLDNPGEDQRIDRRCACPQERPRAGVDGGAGGQHVVD